MIWNEEKDELLCREILVVNVFCGTKRSTVARGAKWEKVAENLSKLQDLYFRVDKRAVRDRYNNPARDPRKKIKNEEKASGIETEMTNLGKALKDLIEREDAAESEQRVVDHQKKQDRENATDMRKRAMESIGQTKKRKESNDDENEGRKFKKRSSGNATVAYLREKNEHLKEIGRIRDEKDAVGKRRKFDETHGESTTPATKIYAGVPNHDEHASKQQSDLMLALVTKLIDKH